MKKITLFIVLAFSCTMTSMAQLNGSGYYRMYNSYNTTHYLSFANYLFNYTTVIGSASSTWNNPAPALTRAGNYLKTDIHLVDDATCTNVSTIFYLKKRTNSSTNYEYDIQAQGTSLLALTTGMHNGSFIKVYFKNRYITIKKNNSSDVYSASIELTSTSGNTLGTRYFIDNSGTFAIAESNTENNALWYIEPVTSFGVNATISYGGKYYATMYTAFAYELDGTVESAYVVSRLDLTNNKVYLTKIASTGQTVPAGTPVILECGSNTPSNNKLKPKEAPLTCTPYDRSVNAPTPNTDTNYSGANYLAGTYFCNTDNVTYNNPKSAISNDQSTMRVLNINSQGKLGFFKLASSVPYMAANKAWLDLSSLPATVNSISRFSVVFNDIEDNDNNEESLVSEDGGFPDSIEAIQNGESKTIVYDLQGRHVSSENLAKGIYIVNGKKVFIQ